MATYTKRGDSWRAQVFRNGKRHSRTFDTRAQAKEWAESLEEDIDRGHRPGKHTFGDAVKKFRDEETPKRKGARWETTRLNKFLNDYPDLMRHELSKLDHGPFTEWKRERMKKVKPGTVLRELNLMQSVMENARTELRWISYNPVKDVARPPAPRPRNRRVPDHEQDAMCDALGWDRGMAENASQRVAVAFLFAIETGMRNGEITSLPWTRVYAKHVHIPESKNGDARDVPLSARARELLECLPRDSDKVFNLNDGTRDALFRKARKRTSITGLTFHDSRHEAITRLARKLEVLDLARMIGQRDIKSLMIYYNPTADELADRLG